MNRHKNTESVSFRVSLLLKDLCPLLIPLIQSSRRRSVTRQVMGKSRRSLKRFSKGIITYMYSCYLKIKDTPNSFENLFLSLLLILLLLLLL